MAASGRERPSVIIEVQTQVSTKVAEEMLFYADEMVENKNRGGKQVQIGYTFKTVHQGKCRSPIFCTGQSCWWPPSAQRAACVGV